MLAIALCLLTVACTQRYEAVRPDRDPVTGLDVQEVSTLTKRIQDLTEFLHQYLQTDSTDTRLEGPYTDSVLNNSGWARLQADLESVRAAMAQVQQRSGFEGTVLWTEWEKLAPLDAHLTTCLERISKRNAQRAEILAALEQQYLEYVELSQAALKNSDGAAGLTSTGWSVRLTRCHFQFTREEARSIYTSEPGFSYGPSRRELSDVSRGHMPPAPYLQRCGLVIEFVATNMERDRIGHPMFSWASSYLTADRSGAVVERVTESPYFTVHDSLENNLRFENGERSCSPGLVRPGNTYTNIPYFHKSGVRPGESCTVVLVLSMPNTPLDHSEYISVQFASEVFGERLRLYAPASAYKTSLDASMPAYHDI